MVALLCRLQCAVHVARGHLRSRSEVLGDVEMAIDSSDVDGQTRFSSQIRQMAASKGVPGISFLHVSIDEPAHDVEMTFFCCFDHEPNDPIDLLLLRQPLQYA